MTNIDFEAWGDYLGDPPLAMAFLDRIVDGQIHLENQRQGLSSSPGTASPIREAIEQVSHQPEPTGQTSADSG